MIFPEEYKKRKFEFYKNKEVFMNSNENKIECVICLNPLFNEEDDEEDELKKELDNLSDYNKKINKKN